MILHKLRVANYRGISNLTIEFSDRISIISGANEAGKSTLIRAFDSLIDDKASSAKADVKRSQPVGQDVGPEVSAELSIGADRIVYTKRWLKDRLTELKFIDGPKKGNALTGDQAHDAALELWSNIDTALWSASRMIQAGALDQASLTDSTALQKALEQTAVSSSDESTPLLDAVRGETSLYFTASRTRETGELKQARETVEKLADKVSIAQHALSRLESTVTDLADLEEQRDRQYPQIEAAAVEVSELQEKAALASATQAKLTEAKRALQDAERDSERNTDLAHHREELVSSLAEAQENLREQTEALTELQESHAPHATRLENESTRLTELRGTVDTLKATLEAARHTNEKADLFERYTSLRDTIEQADGFAEKINELTELLPTIDRQKLTELEQIDRELTIARARLESTATRIQVTATKDVEIDGTTTRELDDYVTSPMTISVPGHADITLTPPETTDIDDVTTRHEAAFESAGFTSLDEAHRALDKRRELVSQIDDLTSDKRALFTQTEAEARAEFARLAEAPPENVQRVDETAHVSELEQAETALRSQTTLVESLNEAHQENRTRLAELTGMIRSLESVVSQADSALQRARDERSDDAITTGVEDSTKAVTAATERVSQLAEELKAHGGTHVLEDLEFATQRHASLVSTLRDTESAIQAKRAVLESVERDRINDEYEQSEADLNHASSELATLERRAQAALRLEKVLLAHQAEVHATYVRPYREALLGVARSFFRAPDMDITVGPDLRIETVTRNGEAIPFDDLSTGTKEQFAILIRLATSSLVAQQDAVPIMLDDTLGYSDQKRLRQIVSLLDRTSEGQVIIFTANEERFAGLAHATTIRV